VVILSKDQDNTGSAQDSSSVIFCSSCGQKNSGDANFCTKCGKQIISTVTAQPTSPSAVQSTESPMESAQKTSGIVTALAVVGFVFGLIGMLGSFVPIVGIFAIKICIGAALISGLSLVIAFAQNANRTFPVVALTISLIGVGMIYMQINKIESAVKSTNKFVDEMRTNLLPNTQQQPAKKSKGPLKFKETENPLTTKYIGTWEYEDKYSPGRKTYLKITKQALGIYKFERGYIYQGNIIWMEPSIENANGIFLKPLNGKLKGEFVSGNFYATHGMNFNYKITLDIKPNNKMVYSVFSSIRGETDKYDATKMSD